MMYRRLFVALFLPLLCFGQNNNFRFDHLTTQFEIMEDGLSANTVLCLFQDSRGFLWIGTYSGLNRYDGYKVKTYKYDDSNEFTISNDGVRGICEDPEGNIWVGTNNGLNKFIREREIFIRYLNKKDTPISLSSNQVNMVYADSKGNIWAATDDGLNMYDVNTGGFNGYKANPDKSLGIVSNRFYSVYEDRAGNLWAGSNNAIYIFDQNKKELISSPLHSSFK